MLSQLEEQAPAGATIQRAIAHGDNSVDANWLAKQLQVRYDCTNLYIRQRNSRFMVVFRIVITDGAKAFGREGKTPEATAVEADERQLIARAATDPVAFGELYERYVDRIYNYIYYRVGSPHDAEDLTSRTFQRALYHISTYVDRGVPFSAWLYRIAHNLVANWYRDRSRRKDIPLDDLVLAAHGSSDPFLQAALGEQIETVRRAVRQLSPDRQTLVVLKHSEHLSNAEIAVILGKTEGAIKSLYHRTLIVLRQIMEDRGDG